MSEQKLFIIGLPRTATTSVCMATLELGYKTAHTAYTHDAFKQAQVIADTPVFCDYAQLDLAFPRARYLYLTRDMSLWIPSVRQLLLRMYGNLQRTDGGFNPTLKRCYQHIFQPLTEHNIQQDDFLRACYFRHQQGIFDYFAERAQDLLTIDVSEKNSFAKLLSFLPAKVSANGASNAPSVTELGFKPINIAGKVTAWNQINHPLKINATRNGKIDKIF